MYKKKLMLSSALLILLGFVTFISCKKNSDTVPEEQSIQSSFKEQMLLKWGQAHNGRWLPYVIDRIKAENPNATGEQVLVLLDSYLKPVNDAMIIYADSLDLNKTETTEEQRTILENYYLQNYDRINNSLHLRKDMDELYNLYSQITVKRIIKKASSTKKTSYSNTLDGVEITACSIPLNIQTWISYYFGSQFWSQHATGVVHSIDRGPNTPECSLLLTKFLEAVVNFANISRMGNPNQAQCDFYLVPVENALRGYQSCPNINGTSPDDPFPPSGGGEPGSGTVTSPDPYSPKNDLPLPCEEVSEPNLFDTLTVQPGIAQAALSGILPYYYQQFISFDSSGNIDIELLKSGQTDERYPFIEQSDLFDALVYVATKPGFRINMFLRSNWVGRTTQDPLGNRYTWELPNQTLWGITIIPGDVPITGIPVTGDKRIGEIYINNAKSSSTPRLGLVVAHELLGHMYRFLKNESYAHGDPKFERWIQKIEALANENWKMLKKWKLSKLTCPQ